MISFLKIYKISGIFLKPLLRMNALPGKQNFFFYQAFDLRKLKMILTGIPSLVLCLIYANYVILLRPLCKSFQENVLSLKQPS